MKNNKLKKFLTIFATFVFVLSLCSICLASSDPTGVDAVASELESGLSASNIWGAIAPLIGVVIIVTLVALARRVLNKNLKSTKSGGSGKV